MCDVPIDGERYCRCGAVVIDFIDDTDTCYLDTAGSKHSDDGVPDILGAATTFIGTGPIGSTVVYDPLYVGCPIVGGVLKRAVGRACDTKMVSHSESQVESCSRKNALGL